MSLAIDHDTVALITGGASGIGFGLARALVERGARVALIGTDQSRLDLASAQLPGATGVRLDVTDREGWIGAVDAVERQLGPIDVAILNAGAQGGRHRIEDVPPAEWDWVWAVNVDGVYNGLRACLPGMRARGFGHVLVTASIAALLPRATVSAYGASKAAALALADAVRLELAGSGVGISVLCPGLVNTPIAETMRRHAPAADADTFAFMDLALTEGLDPLAVGVLPSTRWPATASTSSPTPTSRRPRVHGWTRSLRRSARAGPASPRSTTDAKASAPARASIAISGYRPAHSRLPTRPTARHGRSARGGV